MRPTRKLGENHCQCAGCGEYFNSETAFGKHRIGPYSARRCLTPAEMLEVGMAKNPGDWWTASPMPDDAVSRTRRSPRTRP